MPLIFKVLHRAVLLTAVLLATTSPAHAVDSATRAAARDLGYEGVQAYQAGDYQTATERLERAYEVLKAPSLALWSARALEKTGKLVEASERYLEATRLPEDSGGDSAVQQKAKRQAAEEREKLLPRIPRLIVEVEGVDPRQVGLTVGGEAVQSALIGTARPTNPGKVLVSAEVGDVVEEETVMLAEGEKQSVTLSFDPAAVADAPPPREGQEGPSNTAASSTTPLEDKEDSRQWRRTAGWIGIGVGAAGIVVGGVTGGIVAAKHGNLDCPDNTCPADVQDEMNSYNALRPVASTGFIVGGVLAAAGVTLLLTTPPKDQSAYVSPYLGFGSAGLKGQF